MATTTAAHWPSLNRHHLEPTATPRQVPPTYGDAEKQAIGVIVTQ